MGLHQKSGLSPDMIRFSIKNPGSCKKKKSHTLDSKKRWQVCIFFVCKYMLVALASLFIWCFTIFSRCSNALKNFPEHHLMINLIEKAGNREIVKTTKQLQRKYAKLKHQVMPRNLPLQVEQVTLSCSSFHTMML